MCSTVAAVPSTVCHLCSLGAGYGFINKELTFSQQLVSSRGFSLAASGSQTLPGAWLGERQAANTALEILLAWGRVAERLQTFLGRCLRAMVSPASGWDLTGVRFKGLIFNRNVSLDFENRSL